MSTPVPPTFTGDEFLSASKMDEAFETLRSALCNLGPENISQSLFSPKQLAQPRTFQAHTFALTKKPVVGDNGLYVRKFAFVTTRECRVAGYARNVSREWSIYSVAEETSLAQNIDFRVDGIGGAVIISDVIRYSETHGTDSIDHGASVAYDDTRPVIIPPNSLVRVTITSANSPSTFSISGTLFLAYEHER